ncbi:MAG: hypothetical protein Kow0092_27790 [Deferrisomatales bacterium]
MTEQRRALRSRVEQLEAENRALRAELRRLRAQVDRTLAWGAWLACQGAEGLFAELLGEGAGDRAEPSGTAQEPGPANGHVTLEQTLRQSRERLLAVRDALGERDRRLEELQRQKDELLSIVAHDLRTPLVAIQGFAQLLRLSAQSAELTSKQQQYVDRICQAVGAMNRLVEDLLTTRQLDRGRLPLRPRAVEVGRFVEEVLGLHREAARQKGVEIRAVGPAGEVRAVFDPDRLAQALGNLVQNAVKFTPEGGVVTVRTGREGRWVVWEVLDQGPGIDEALLPRLFERNAQGPTGPSAGRGYGLGLFICREIARLHGGEVRAENLEAGGSRFRMAIPFTAPADG